MNNKNLRYNILISVVMITIAISIYVLQIVLFKDPHESMFLLFQDLAFLPISVILISYILEKYLKNKEKEENFKKLQIVVSAFYSEVGSSLIRKISHFDSNLESFKEKMDFEQELKKKDKKKIIKLLRNFEYDIDSHTANLEDLKQFLISKKMYISRMFENPNLLEHSRFTDMLWSVYHLLDELENREDLQSLPINDMLHLSIDILRAYPLLIIEWFEYMTYLRQEYPYLYSLAIRKSPFENNHIIID
ncbi:MAG: hypothetical protein FD141_145 [Fusobacteria bacterium]|nr:MAG: hypothetical protein FD141_145 [Fusobacteriota bacterium]KAF0229191.1 MAG: hypothetical protein FD182_1447 [Fusobacteriota bacterium]